MLGSSIEIDGDLTYWSSYDFIKITFFASKSFMAVFQFITESGKKLTGFPFPLRRRQSCDNFFPVCKLSLKIL